MQEILIVTDKHCYYAQSNKTAPVTEIKFPYMINYKNNYIKFNSKDVRMYIIRDNATSTVYAWKQPEKILINDNSKKANNDFDKLMNNLNIGRDKKTNAHV